MVGAKDNMFIGQIQLVASQFVTSDLGLSVRILGSVSLLVHPLISKISLVLEKAPQKMLLSLTDRKSVV